MQKIFTYIVAWVARNKLFLGVELVLVFLFILTPTIVFNRATAASRYSAMNTNWEQRVPERNVAIVLGAGVLPDRTPTPYLKGRIETAVDLYKVGKVHKLLMSGDNSTSHYNEPEVMGAYAESLGVSKQDIALDFAGFNTYDTCYRAKYIFQLSEAMVISQGYHVPRAVATCNRLGVKSIGVAAKHTSRDFTVSYIGREVLSTNKAAIQMVTLPKATVLGAPEPITQ